MHRWSACEKLPSLLIDTSEPAPSLGPCKDRLASSTSSPFVSQKQKKAGASSGWDRLKPHFLKVGETKELFGEIDKRQTAYRGTPICSHLQPQGPWPLPPHKNAIIHAGHFPRVCYVVFICCTQPHVALPHAWVVTRPPEWQGGHAKRSHDIRHKTPGLCANDATGSKRVQRGEGGERAKPSFLASFLTAKDGEE